MPIYQSDHKLKIHYRDENPQGERTVVLLHGLGASGDSWILQFPALTAAGYRCLAPDGRGFGRSTYPGGAVSPAVMAGDLNLLLEHLRIEQAAVVGISMGGATALQFALDHPVRVERLVLVNTFAHLQADKLSQWFYFLLRQLLVHTLGLEAQAKAVAGRVFPHPDQGILREQLIAQIRQATPRAYRSAMRQLPRFDVQTRLAEIHLPTLVLTGAADSTVLPARQAALVQDIPGAQQVIIPAAGHAVSVDQPEAFNQALLAFLKQPIL
ncbi:MAG: alpha/beta fold hydrolase [Anaerolineales bacterium]|nr:alpha/beta fold hydrolase [Anaerolineales bacterium]